MEAKGIALGEEAAAYHEAGHAVMALCVGGAITHEGIEIVARQYCSVRLPCTERALLLFKLAGWLAEHLHHGLGALHPSMDELLWAIGDARDTSPEGDDDDTDAIRVMLLAHPRAINAELACRYIEFTSECLTILNRPAVWAAVEVLARKLLEAGEIDADEAMKAVGDIEPLLEAGRKAAVKPAPTTEAMLN